MGKGARGGGYELLRRGKGKERQERMALSFRTVKYRRCAWYLSPDGSGLPVSLSRYCTRPFLTSLERFSSTLDKERTER